MNTPTSLRLGRGLSFGLSLILCLSFFTACKSQQMNGKKILSDQFERIELFKSNYLVQKGHLKGLYNTSGRQILPCNFNRIELYTGNYLVQQGNKKGLYDTSGKQILPCKYKNITMYRGEWEGVM